MHEQQRRGCGRKRATTRAVSGADCSGVHTRRAGKPHMMHLHGCYWLSAVLCYFFSTNGWLGFPCIEWVKESRMWFLQGKPYFWQRWFLMCVHMHVHFFHNWLQRCGRIKGSRFNSTQVNNLNLIMKICLFLWISSSYYMSFSVPWP